MILRSPIAAMVWENWRLTRVEAARRLALGLVAGSGALVMWDGGAVAAFWILLSQHALFYMSIAKLNGGRFMDGYKPGFPLYLLYARPVPTSTFVGVAMAYDALTCAASYLVSAALLGVAFGQVLPLFSVTALIVVFHLAYACIQWSTRSRVIQWIGSIVITLPTFFLLNDVAPSPKEVAFSPGEYAAMCAIAIVSIVLTIMGVARQRRGDAVATVPGETRTGGYPEWVVNLFRFPCPRSSATRAQVWFELRSSGLPTLAIGLALAVLIFLLFAISIPVELVRPAAISSVLLAAPALFFWLGGNAFGIRRKQGRSYASAFELTQSWGTAHLACLKVSVRTACVLVAMTAVALSLWASSSLISAWGSWIVDGGKDAVPDLLKSRQELIDAFAGLFAHSYVAPVVIAFVAVAVMVAALATFAAVRTRYLRRLLIAGSVLLSHGLALVLLSLAEQKGLTPTSLVATIFAATGWILLTAMVAATVYLSWSGLVERLLTIRYTSAAFLISVAFAAAWLTVLQAGGVQIPKMPAGTAISVLWPALLPLLVSVAAPWSLSRVRHT
jgi:hypothetical protein